MWDQAIANWRVRDNAYLRRPLWRPRADWWDAERRRWSLRDLTNERLRNVLLLLGQDETTDELYFFHKAYQSSLDVGSLVPCPPHLYSNAKAWPAACGRPTRRGPPTHPSRRGRPNERLRLAAVEGEHVFV